LRDLRQTIYRGKTIVRLVINWISRNIQRRFIRQLNVRTNPKAGGIVLYEFILFGSTFKKRIKSRLVWIDFVFKQ
jgi:hypothetical protein